MDAQNWHRFRGTTGKGVFPTIELPIDWSSQDYLWSIKLPGVGHSSPVIWEEIVFTTCASPDGKLQFVLALDARNGRKFGKIFSLFQVHPYINLIVMHLPPLQWTKIMFSFPGQRKNRTTCTVSIIKERKFGEKVLEHTKPNMETVFPHSLW